MSNIQGRVEKLERGTGMHGKERIVVIKTNVPDGDEKAVPCYAQLAQRRAEGSKHIVIYKRCDMCKGSCDKTKISQDLNEEIIEVA
jgi:hypothetical protein